MICRLCLQNKVLLKQSHIAPNFFYKELRDKDNSFLAVRLVDVTYKPSFTGLFESNILCQECDNIILGKLEDYAYKVLYEGKLKGLSFRNEITPEGVEWLFCDGVDYKKFKLFLLSLIWRFSISSKEFYRFVNLGKHEEVLRKMIFEGNPGDALDYPCAITSYRKYTDLPFEIISQPLKHRENGGICYGFIMNGLLFIFYVSKNLTPNHISEIAISKSGQLRVVQIPRNHAVKIIRKYMGLKAS